MFIYLFDIETDRWSKCYIIFCWSDLKLVVNAFQNNNDQVITGNDDEPNCFATSDGMQNYFSHAASNFEGIDASILLNECITRNIKYSSFFYEIVA